MLFLLGRPTIEKCKKLRRKIELKKEIAELDLGNIIDDGGGSPFCDSLSNCISCLLSTHLRRQIFIFFLGVCRNRRCTRGVLKNSSLSAAADELKNRFSRIKALKSSGSESD